MLRIGIDGGGGAGKSTLAQAVKDNSPNITIVQMDDFYFKDRFDCQRLKKQVLEPLSRNQTAEYQRYDWRRKTLAEWRKVEAGGMLIVEGVYSTGKELADFYDYKVWVDCPREIRLKRGLERDGEKAREIWEKQWMPAEDFYIVNDSPRERADLIINGYD